MAGVFQRWRGLLPGVLLLALPASAHAHGAIPGLEGFTSGLLHPLTIPAHVLIILALGLLLGQQTPLDLKKPLFIFMPLLALGLLLTISGRIKEVYPPILNLIALGAAALVVLQKPMPVLVVRALCAVAAIAIGLDSGPESGSTAVVIKTLLGTWVVVVFLLFDVGYYTSLEMRKQWLRISVRILGSWIVAISLLMLAFALKKQP